MNFWDIAILLAVGLLAGLALYRMRKNQHCGCCADCGACSGVCPAAKRPPEAPRSPFASTGNPGKSGSRPAQTAAETE